MGKPKLQQTTTVCPICGRSLGLLERNAAIIKEREQGATLAAIAQRYGLTRARIYAICEKAEQWKERAKEPSPPSSLRLKSPRRQKP
jgi:Helix-turn-helix domain